MKEFIKFVWNEVLYEPGYYDDAARKWAFGLGWIFVVLFGLSFAILLFPWSVILIVLTALAYPVYYSVREYRRSKKS